MTNVSQKDKKEDFLLKIIIIGDSGVGKTNVLVRFCENQFKQNYVATIGVDFKIKSLRIRDSKLKFQIWDTAGQERYKTIAQTYYKGASGIVLTYSITDQNSFNNIQNWIMQISQHSSSDIKKILIGNKSDLTNERLVSYENGKKLAQKYDMKFLEVSAKTGNNVLRTFEVLGEEILEHNLKNPTTLQNAKLSMMNEKQGEKSKKGCAC